MPVPLPADAGLGTLWALLPGARVVGGAVRDLLAGREIADFDLASPDPPEVTARVLGNAGIRTVPTGLSHGTVTAVVAHRAYEITTLRRDLSGDGRRAEVAWTADWREDAARRDFTINAMSLDRDGVVHDWFGGRADLRAGRVRFVGDAATRIREDHLRILRFFRFHARYGGDRPDPEAVAAIAAAADSVRRLSAERVWGEIKRLLALPDPAPTVGLMRGLGVLDAVLERPCDLDRLAALVAIGGPAEPVLRLASLLGAGPDDPDAGAADGGGAAADAALAARLKLSGAERRRLLALRTPPAPTPASPPGTLPALLADHEAPVLIGRAWLAEAAAGGADAPAWAALRATLARLPRPVFPLAGQDALREGAPPGPAVGAALASIRDWWLEAGCVPDRAACLAALRRLLRGDPGADFASARTRR